MFKILSSRRDDPGFENSVIIGNLSQSWLPIDDDGNQLPPVTFAAIDYDTASMSTQIADLVSRGLVVVLGNIEQTPNRSKKKKKAELETVLPQTEPEVVVLQVEPEVVPVEKVLDNDNIVTNLLELENDALVAQSSDENWVSSNENNIVNPNTI